MHIDKYPEKVQVVALSIARNVVGFRLLALDYYQVIQEAH